MKTEFTTEINCTPERLWSWIEEPEKQKKWMTGLLDNKSTSEGPTRVGSTFHMKIKEGGRIAAYDGRITAYTPYRHLGLTFGGEAMKGTQAQVDYRLADLGNRTRLDYVSTIDAAQAGFFIKLLMPLFALFGRAQLRKFMKALKQHAEAEASAPVGN